MASLPWLNSLRRPARRPIRNTRLRLERLEDRTVPATFIVDSPFDDVEDGDFVLTLREAIIMANANPGADAIEFDLAALQPTFGRIALNGTQLPVITDDLTITGPGADFFTIDAQFNSRIFETAASTTVALARMTMTRGRAFQGGAISNHGALSVDNCILRGNSAAVGGGAICSDGETVLTVTHSFFGSNAALQGGAIDVGDLFKVNRLAIFECNFAGNSAVHEGGAVFLFGSDPTSTASTCTATIVDSTLTNNSAGYGGGAIWSDFTMTVTNCTLAGNSTAAPPWESGGGAILNWFSELTIINSALIGNSAAQVGGAIYTVAGDVTMINSRLTNNTAGERGGGIFIGANNSKVVTLSDCIIEGNSAGAGGGVYKENSNYLTATSTVFHGNSAQTNGGALYNGSGFLASMTLADCEVGDNSASAAGGGVFSAGNLYVASSAFRDNSASRGGGVYSIGDISVSSSLIANNSAALAGGGVFVVGHHGAITTLSDSLVENNSAPAGGGIYKEEAPHTGLSGLEGLNVIRTTIHANTTVGSGGGIYNVSGDLTLTDCDVNDNVALFGDGGAAFNTGRVTIERTRLNGNSGVSGGGVMNLNWLFLRESDCSGNQAIDGAGLWNGGNVSVSDSTFTSNSAEFIGGAIRNTGSLILFRSTLSGNSAETGSGGAISNSGTLTSFASTFSGNAAGSNGGALATDGAFATLVNITLSGNSAKGDGGAVWSDGQLGSVNSTVVLNRADADNDGVGVGGGVWVAQPQSTRLINTIIAGNTHSAVATADDFVGGTDALSQHNLIGDPATSGDLTNGSNGNIVGVPLAQVVDPVLRNNGGLSATHALVPDSPAINAGNNSMFTFIPVDQRGLPRIFDGTIDIGAYELQNARPAVSDFTKTGAEDNVLAFSTADFAANFADPDGDAMVSVRIVSLPANGTLKLNGVSVSVGQVIAAADLENLEFVPALNFNGVTSFTFTASDGIAGSATSPGTVTIDIPSSFRQADNLMTQIDALIATGVLTDSQGRSLKKKLRLNGDPNHDAHGVGRFIDQIHNFVADGILTQAQAGPLLTAGNTLLISITTT